MNPQAIKFAPGSEVIVEGLGIPFGGPFNGRDIDGEYFSKDTDFCLEWFEPGQRPTLYHHGKDAALKTDVTGRVMSYDPMDVGIWTRAQLDSRNKYLGAIQQLVQDGALGFSSGAIPHLVQVDHKSGHIDRWPWIELSLTPMPANPDAVAMYAVKSADALEHLSAAGVEDALDRLITSPETKSAPLGGLTYADQTDRVLVQVKALVDRSQDLAAKRGVSRGSTAVLSAENRSRLSDLQEQLKGVSSDLDALLRLTDPNVGERAEQARELFAEFAAIEARLNGVNV